MRKSLNIAVAGLLLGSLVGCAEGTDPYKVFSNEPGIPVIGFPIDLANVTQVATDADRNTLQITSSGGISQSVLSPVNGYVSAVEGSGNFFSITIHYNREFKIHISNLSSNPSIRQGDYVEAGQILGATLAGSRVDYTAIWNGTVSCPYPFMSDEAQKKARDVNTLGVGIAPCP